MAALKVQRPFRRLLGLMGNAGKDASQGQRGGKEEKRHTPNNGNFTMPIFFLILRFVFLCFSPVPQNSVHCSAVILKSEREPKLSAVH